MVIRITQMITQRYTPQSIGGNPKIKGAGLLKSIIPGQQKSRNVKMHSKIARVLLLFSFINLLPPSE